MTNVLLVLMDSVRARNCSVYGHVEETTPFLERFAERATVYEHGHSPGAKSASSHASIFTGLHVEEHGIDSAQHRLREGLSVFEQLRDEEGYETGVFSENSWITEVDIGLKDGFDHVVGPRNLPFPDAADPESFVAEEGRGEYGKFLRRSLDSGRPIRSLANGVASKLAADYPRLLPRALKSTTPAEVYTEEFLDWQAERVGPWAACINFMDAHIPYLPASSHDRWGGETIREIHRSVEDQKWSYVSGQRPMWERKAFESLYDGAIHQMDAQLERLVTTLENRGELDDTLVVISADHGEGFGEPSEIRPGIRCVEHGVSIHEVLTHVPLVVQYPHSESGERVAAPASLTEFPNVVRDAVDNDAGPGAFVPEGPVLTTAVGLNPALQRRAAEFVDDLDPFLETARAVHRRREDHVEKAVRWGDRGATLHVRDAQTSYVTEQSETTVETAFADIEDAGVRVDSAGEMEDATKQRLEDLGYL